MRSTSVNELSEGGDARPSLGDLLAREQYVNRRLRPSLRDQDYLVLKDLHQLVSQFAQAARGRVFDYGCGGAPYRTLFHCQQYVAADVTPGPHVDVLLGADGFSGEPAASYDAVLSTQVLEHVADPAAYLQECYRILKPGGHLILSTHGMIEEHGCPDDYYRWTSRGLERLVADHGFHVAESFKFTTEIRAVAQLLHQFVGHFRCRERQVWRYPLALIRRLYQWIGVPLFNWLADWLPRQAVVPASDPASLYAGVCVRAEKPLGG
jgi:SAM-dependent methyltransferase